jgi:hypothetical protein
MAEKLYHLRVQLAAYTAQQEGPKALQLAFNREDVQHIQDCVEWVVSTSRGQESWFSLPCREATAYCLWTEVIPQTVDFFVSHSGQIYILACFKQGHRLSIRFTLAQLMSACSHPNGASNIICDSREFEKLFGTEYFRVVKRPMKHYRIKAHEGIFDAYSEV